MARLDRLAPGKSVIQLGATLGREFSYDVLQAVSALDDGTLQHELARLVGSEFLFQRGVPPQARYVFKHALVQDAAYQALLKSTRQQYHQQIAHVLEERFGEVRETQPELVAHHYSEAGLHAQAIPYWQQAGQRAVQRSAHVEAIAHLRKGLELLKTLPDTPERAQQELTLQTLLGTPLMATKGYAIPEVETAYTRAHELCLQVGETSQLFPVLWGLWQLYFARAEFTKALEYAEQFLTLAQRLQNSLFLQNAHEMLGTCHLWVGEFVLARRYLEQGMAPYDVQQRNAHAFRAVQDPGVSCLSFTAMVLWFLGYPEQAKQRIHDAVALAQELKSPYSVAFALRHAALVHQRCGDVQATKDRAEALMALCVEQGFPFFLAGGTVERGWALAERGQAAEGIAQICQGLAVFRATGSEINWPHLLLRFAEAHGKAGQAEKGLQALEEALAIVGKTGERWHEAELYRLKGELMLQSNVQEPRSEMEEVERYFLKAIEIACEQRAKSWELRAAMSLARLWQRQGKRREAHQMLSEVYGWFTEGFDTKDLQEAKILLEQVSR